MSQKALVTTKYYMKIIYSIGKLSFLFLFCFFSIISNAQISPTQEKSVTNTIKITIASNEYWWAGLSAVGHQTPYSQTTITSKDLWGDNQGNQAQPLLLSSKGRYVWSESPLKYEFNKGMLTVTVREGQIVSGTAGNNLRTAYEFAVKNFFPPDGKIPEEHMFTIPQYNTWIELVYNQNE